LNQVLIGFKMTKKTIFWRHTGKWFRLRRYAYYDITYCELRAKWIVVDDVGHIIVKVKTSKSTRPDNISTTVHDYAIYIAC